jgi:hypothetical protein
MQIEVCLAGQGVMSQAKTIECNRSPELLSTKVLGSHEI